jgi:hypothetical protein
MMNQTDQTKRECGMPANHRLIGALLKKRKLTLNQIEQCFDWKEPYRNAEQAKQVIRTCATNYSDPSWLKSETRGHPTKFSSEYETLLCEEVNEEIVNRWKSGQKWSVAGLLRAALEERGYRNLSSNFYNSFLTKRHPLDVNGFLFVDDFRLSIPKPHSAAVKLTAFGYANLTADDFNGIICVDDGDNDGIVDFTNDVCSFSQSSSSIRDTEGSLLSEAAYTNFFVDVMKDPQDCDMESLQPGPIVEESLSVLDDDADWEAGLLLSFSSSIEDVAFDSLFCEDFEDSIVDSAFSVAQLNVECHLFRVYQHFGTSDLTLIEANNPKNTFISAVLYTLRMTVYFRQKHSELFIDPLTLRHCVLHTLMSDSREYMSEYLKTGNEDYTLVYSFPLSAEDWFDVNGDFISDVMRSGCEQHNFIDVGRLATARLMNIGNHIYNLLLILLNPIIYFCVFFCFF